LKVFLLLLLVVLSLNSCAKRPGKSQITFSTQFATQGTRTIELNGGVIIAGYSTTNDSAFVTSLNSPLETKTVFLTNGTWKFIAMGWSGLDQELGSVISNAIMLGTARCSSEITQTLDGNNTTISLTINTNNCLTTSQYANQDYMTEESFKTLNIRSCAYDDGGGLGCTYPGNINSIKISIPQYELEQLSKLQEKTAIPSTTSIDNFVSTCFPLDSGYISTNIQIPVGTNLINDIVFPTIIGYKDAACADPETTAFGINFGLGTLADKAVVLDVGQDSYTAQIYTTNENTIPNYLTVLSTDPVSDSTVLAPISSVSINFNLEMDLKSILGSSGGSCHNTTIELSTYENFIACLPITYSSAANDNHDVIYSVSSLVAGRYYVRIPSSAQGINGLTLGTTYTFSFIVENAPLAITTTNLIATYEFSFDASKFILGGTPPINYSNSNNAIGSINNLSGIYSPIASGNDTLTISDANGSHDINLTIVATTHSYDFQYSMPSAWNLTRNTSGYYLNNSGNYVEAASNIERFEYDYALYIMGLLVEPSSTNLINYSEDFSNSAWTKISTAVTSNIVVAPASTTMADEVTDDNSNAFNAGYVTTTRSKSSAQAVFSVFAKPNTAHIVSLYLAVPASSCAGAVFDLSSGSSTNSGFCGNPPEDFGIERYPNGWFRLWVREYNTTGSNWEARVFVAYNSVLSSSADIATVGSIYLFGAQLEERDTPTSYIPTNGSSISRSNDDLSSSFANINATNGTIFIEWINKYPNSQMDSFLFATDQDTNNHHTIYLDPSSYLNFEIVGNGTSLTQKSPAPVLMNSRNKTAYAYTNNGFYGSLNGTSSFATTTSMSLPQASTIVKLGSDINQQNQLNGNIVKYYFWNQPLSPEIIQQMTALP